MNDFDYDVKQKKNIARSARYVKNGSKSRKCSLPSDNLNEREWRERNGEIVNYAMNAPMSWGVFTSMSDELQGEYMLGLCEKYHPSQRDFAAMLGVSSQTAYARIKKLGGWPFSKEEKRSKEEKAAWARFLGNWVPQKGIIVKEQKVDESAEGRVVERIEEKPKSPKVLKIEKGNLTFAGSPEEIADTIVKILGDGRYTVNIEFSAT